MLRDPAGQCHQSAWGRRYWEHLAAVTDRETLAAMPCCPAARRGYQLFRQTALAEGIARSGKYDLTVSAVALDERNDDLNGCLRKLGISDLHGWGTVFRGGAIFAVNSGQDPKTLKISREQLIGLIQSDAKFLDEREEITEYVRSLTEGEGLDEAAIRAGYEQFKAEKQVKEVADLAQAHGLTTESLAAFVDTILQRMIFDGEQLTDLMEPLDLGWRERREQELALMARLVPLDPTILQRQLL